ncbi:MAG: universal stress protein [Planctomycetales bacterium]
MKVVIGVDGSTESLEAVRFTGRLLSGDEHEIQLYYSAPPKLGTGAELEPGVLERARGALGSAVFQEARSRLPVPLREHVTETLGGQEPAHGLVLAADKQDADLIVVGARGLGGFQEVLLGSVSKSVAHESNRPALIVRSSKNAEPKPLRALLACDRTPASEEASRFINRLHWPADCFGRVVSVVESVVSEIPAWLREAAEQEDAEAVASVLSAEREKCEEQLQRLSGELPDAFRREPPLIREGGPAQQILETIRDERIDLAIVGSRNLSGWRRVWMGSVSDKVLNLAPCSVLIVRFPEEP